MDGTYMFTYSGSTGIGIGFFVIENSVLKGSDWGGAKYKGRAVEISTGEIDLSIEMAIPAGLPLVQGTSPQELAYTKSVSFKAPRNFGDGKAFDIPFSPESITLIVQRVSDEYSGYANGININIEPVLA